MQVTKLSDEQHALRDVTRDVLERESSPAHVRRLTDGHKTFSRKLWSLAAEVGWQGLEAPEAYGGSGQSYFETAIVLRELGRATALGPFLSHNLAVAALTALPDHSVTRSWLERLATGEAIGSVVIGTMDVTGVLRLDVSAKASDTSLQLQGREFDVPDL